MLIPPLAEIAQVAVAHPEGPAHGLAELLRDLGHVLHVVDAGQEQRELVAREPGHGVAQANAGGEPLGHRLQKLVARRVAEGVVHGLEPVEIDEHHRQAMAVAAGLGEGDAEPVVEEASVGQPGEGVAVGERRHLLLRALAVGDVAHHHLHRGLPVPREGDDRHFRVHRGPVLAQQLLLDEGAPHAVLKRGFHPLRQGFLPLGFEHLEERDPGQTGGVRGGEEPREGDVGEHHAAGDDDGHAVGVPVDERAKPVGSDGVVGARSGPSGLGGHLDCLMDPVVYLT